MGVYLEVAGARELAVVERNGFIESRHVGVGVVVDAAGDVLESVGDVESLIFPRSSLKPFQATAVLRLGANLTGEELALATASHVGTPEHVRVVERMLQGAGLDESALQCPPDWPSEPRAAADARITGGRRRVTMNCSGKHAGFLAACVAQGWPLENHLDPAHPLQRAIADTIEEFAGESIGHVGTDGCGAPLFAISTLGLSRATGRFARGAEEATASIRDAVLAHPWAIAGEGVVDTRIIGELGLFAKRGAEGVLVVGAHDGRAAAVKILDGSMRATGLVALELLARAGVISRADADRVAPLTTERVLGGGALVGEVRAAF